MSHEGFHEPVELLTGATQELHRALVSLIEELEAIDWYQQRADACSDDGLRSVMLHNRNEEVEHAMMALEWIRRRDPKFDETARTYLFKAAPITEIEKADEGSGGGAVAGGGGAVAGGGGAVARGGGGGRGAEAGGGGRGADAGGGMGPSAAGGSLAIGSLRSL